MPVRRLTSRALFQNRVLSTAFLRCISLKNNASSLRRLDLFRAPPRFRPVGQKIIAFGEAQHTLFTRFFGACGARTEPPPALKMSQSWPWPCDALDGHADAKSECVNVSPKASLECPHCGIETEHDLRAVVALGRAVCQNCHKSFDQYPSEVQAKMAMLGDDFPKLKVSPYPAGPV